MTIALRLLGPSLHSLPDGETGVRNNWVAAPIQRLREHPDFEPVTPGGGGRAQVRVRPGHRVNGALDLGHVAAASDSYPVFKDVTAAHEGVAFQQGLPGDMDMAVSSLGLVAGLRHRRAFTEATLAEIHHVRRMTAPSTLFQIEVPLELVLVAKAPPPARRALAALLARGVARLAIGAPEGTRFAVHLCVGDQDHKAMTTPADVAPLVALANAVFAHWPAGRPLVLVHAPFAAAERPASTSAAFLQPLRDLHLPSGVAFAAGFAHEDQSLADQVQIRDRAEDLLQREVAVAAACGLGRRSEAAGTAVLERMAELCDAT